MPGKSLIYRFAILVCLSFCGGTYADEFPDVVARVSQSVVAVGVVRPGKSVQSRGAQVEYRGTGFIIGDGLTVVTNAHVVGALPDDEVKAFPAVFIGRGDAAEARRFRLVKEDETHDIAILAIDGPALPALSLDSRKRIREGMDMAFTGFPIGMVLGLYPVTHRSIVSAITPVVIPAMSSRTLTAAQIRSLKTPFDVYQLDAIAYPGNSGSPVYDPGTGAVMGVVNSVFVKETKEAILERPSGITYAIPARFVQELLADD